MTVPSVTAPCFQVPGPVQVWVGTGSAAAMEFFGYTRGGVRITEQAFWDELKSDVSGGERGPMADAQFLGEQHTVDVEMAQYTEAILNKLLLRVNAGATRVPGMLMNCSGAYFRLALIASNFVRNYTRVLILDPIDHGAVGFTSKYPRVNFTCLQDPSATAGTNGAPTIYSPWNTAVTVSGSSVT